MLCFVLVVYHDIINDASEAWESYECLVHPTVVVL